MAYSLDEEILKNVEESLKRKEGLEAANQKQRLKKISIQKKSKSQGDLEYESEGDLEAAGRIKAGERKLFKKNQPGQKSTDNSVEETAGDSEENVVVPNIVGMPFKRAEELLSAAGLGAFPYYVKGDSPEPMVLSTQPSPGTEVAPGQTVTLTVAMGAQEEEEDPDKQNQQEEEEEPAEEEPGGEEEDPESLKDKADDLKKKAGQARKALKWYKRFRQARFIAWLAGTWEIWLPVLLVGLAIFFLIGIAIIAPVAFCNSGGEYGYMAGMAVMKSTPFVGSFFGAAEAYYGTDFCKYLKATNSDSEAAKGLVSENPGDQEAENRLLLAEYDITVNKPAPDTQVGGMQLSSLYEIIKLSQACDAWARRPGDSGPPGNRCGIMVTGGNEPGHSTGTCSHATGYKFDLRLTSLLDEYIRNTNAFRAIGPRSDDGAQQYVRQSGGAVYAREGDHWDVKVGC